jgi:hypothetical protein
VAQGVRLMRLSRCSALMASTSATKAPVIAAVRVPPSAWITSQSRVIVYSPSAQVHGGAQGAADEALDLQRAPALLAAGRLATHTLPVERGSMPYSAVTQPWPRPRRKRGTPSSTLAVQSTRVRRSSPARSPPRGR